VDVLRRKAQQQSAKGWAKRMAGPKRTHRWRALEWRRKEGNSPAILGKKMEGGCRTDGY
jgi:hypothetical protein